MFAAIKMLLVYVPFGLLAGIIGIPYTLLAGNIHLLYRVSMSILRAGVWAGGIVVHLSGTEHIPAGRSCIFMSNHVSNLDPPVLLPLMPGRTAVMLKKELMAIPILGTAMRMGMFIPVERGAKREAAQASVIAAGKALEAGLHLLVFPEGTRSLNGRLSSFKKGPFYLAQQTGAPVVPMAIWGTERMMRKGNWRVTPGVAHVLMLPAIYPEEHGSREALLEAVRTAISTALPEAMRAAAVEVRSAR